MAFAPRLRRFHRWHALVMSVVVLGSSLSGLLHTWMARTQAPPPSARPTAAVDLGTVVVAPSAIAAALPADAGRVVSANIRPIDGAAWYQVIASGRKQPIYVDGATGRIDEGVDARYAQQIARDALGGRDAVPAGYLTAFDDEYIAIFRILPVYRFDAGDGRGSRVYVSTMTGSVTRFTDDARQVEANVFTYLHKWGFIRNRTARDVTLMCVMASIVLMALSGMALFWLSRPRRSATPLGEQP
jgi:hypothetical protein